VASPIVIETKIGVFQHNRRIADVAARGAGRLNWADSRPTGSHRRTAASCRIPGLFSGSLVDPPSARNRHSLSPLDRCEGAKRAFPGDPLGPSPKPSPKQASIEAPAEHREVRIPNNHCWLRPPRRALFALKRQHCFCEPRRRRPAFRAIDESGGKRARSEPDRLTI